MPAPGSLPLDVIYSSVDRAPPKPKGGRASTTSKKRFRSTTLSSSFNLPASASSSSSTTSASNFPGSSSSTFMTYLGSMFSSTLPIFHKPSDPSDNQCEITSNGNSKSKTPTKNTENTTNTTNVTKSNAADVTTTTTLANVSDSSFSFYEELSYALRVVAASVSPSSMARAVSSCWFYPSPTIGAVDYGYEYYFGNAPILSEPVGPVLPRKTKVCTHTLVLDLDETLIHSSFVAMDDFDFSLSITINGESHNVYVIKRPGVDAFLRAVTEWYEVVVFTASIPVYANPVIDILDERRTIDFRLYRDSCTNIESAYVKDLSKLGRDLNKIILVDNSPVTYAFQPENALPISSFVHDRGDTELDYVLDILRKAKDLDDVRGWVM